MCYVCFSLGTLVLLLLHHYTHSYYQQIHIQYTNIIIQIFQRFYSTQNYYMRYIYISVSFISAYVISLYFTFFMIMRVFGFFGLFYIFIFFSFHFLNFLVSLFWRWLFYNFFTRGPLCVLLL